MAMFVTGTIVKLIQYVLRYQGGSMVLKRLDIPNASDVNSKLTASGTTEDLTVDSDGNLGLSYGDGFIERLCSDMGRTEQSRTNLTDNENLAALASNAKFCSELAHSQTLGQILAGLNQPFIETLAFNTGFYSALIANSGFCSALATSSRFCSALANNSFFEYTLTCSQSFCSYLAANSGFRDSLISNLSTAQVAVLKKKLGV